MIIIIAQSTQDSKDSFKTATIFHFQNTYSIPNLIGFSSDLGCTMTDQLLCLVY